MDTPSKNILGKEILIKAEFPLECVELTFDAVTSSVQRYCDSSKCKGEMQPASDYWIAKRMGPRAIRNCKGCVLALFCLSGNIPPTIHSMQIHEFSAHSTIAFSDAKVTVCLNCGEVGVSHG